MGGTRSINEPTRYELNTHRMHTSSAPSIPSHETLLMRRSLHTTHRSHPHSPCTRQYSHSALDKRMELKTALRGQCTLNARRLHPCVCASELIKLRDHGPLLCEGVTCGSLGTPSAPHTALCRGAPSSPVLRATRPSLGLSGSTRSSAWQCHAGSGLVPLC